MVNSADIFFIKLFQISVKRNHTTKYLKIRQKTERRNMKRQNIIRNTLLIILTIYFILQICKNCSDYSFLDWIAIAWILACLYAAVIVIFKIIENEGLKKKAKVELPVKQEPEKIDGVLYVETEHGIARADGKDFTDEEVPYLMQRSYEKAVKRYEKLSEVNPKFQRSFEDEERAFNFRKRNGKVVGVLEDNFQNLYRNAYCTEDLTKRIAMLEKAALAFGEAKEYCYSKGKYGQIYFQDMWEYMHNSRSNCFSYLDTINNSIEETKWKRDVVIPNILETIRNNDGILQKDIYAKLPHIAKEEIQYYLKHFEHESVITRIKKGNSYELHIK